MAKVRIYSSKPRKVCSQRPGQNSIYQQKNVYYFSLILCVYYGKYRHENKQAKHPFP